MPQRDEPSAPRTLFFWGCTIVYAALVTWISFQHSKSLFDLDAAGWGNLLSGVFSPLAFLWLLYAALAQRTELHLQREELRQNNQSQLQQAEALETQARGFQAQADASYSPIIILESSGHHERGILLELMNRGASVFDLRGNEDVVFSTAQQSEGGPWIRAPGAGHTLPLWGTNCRMQIVVSSDRDEDGGAIFVLDVRRHDLLRVRYRCRYINPEQRIRVLEREVEVPGQGKRDD